MRIKTWVEIAQEVEVNVAIADMMSSISELSESDRMPMLLECINSVHNVLTGVTGEQIECMTEAQRALIGKALSSQADRYLTPNA